MRAITLLGLGTALLLLAPSVVFGQQSAKASSSFETVAARLRTAFERDKQMPLDADLYADNLHVSHNYEPGRNVEVPTFLKGVATELAAAKRVGAQNHAELTRFLVSGDTVVATVLNTGHLADGSATRFYIAYFFTIKDGRVVDLETWYDRKGSEQQAQAIAKEMKGADTSPKATP